MTAIPVNIQNGDSPPESLNINNGDNNNHNNNNSNSNNNHINTFTNQQHTINNNNVLPNCNNMLSPSKQLLTNNSISIINNSFDKAHLNGISNNNTNSNIINIGNNNKLCSLAPDFYNKKSMLKEQNATVFNGMMKNLQTGEQQHHNNNNNNNNSNSNNAYKKYENEANRLNNFYNQFSSPKIQSINTNSVNTSPSIQNAQNALAAVLSPKKTLNGFDFTQSTNCSTPINSHLVKNSDTKGNSFLNFSNPTSPLMSPTHNYAYQKQQQQVQQSSQSQTTADHTCPISQYNNQILNSSANAIPIPPPPPPLPADMWSGLQMPTNSNVISGLNQMPNEMGK